MGERILVTGATGYIGGRLIPLLLAKGHPVRVLVRDPRRIKGRSWEHDVEVVTGDLMQPESLASAFKDIDVVYYLVHSMASGRDFPEKDREAANNVVQAAGGIRLLVYLGGLYPNDLKGAIHSRHLESRAEVGAILREHLPTTEFRAGPIIGSGSASFEIVRHLTERLPVMITPKWVGNLCQPIGVDDALAYLVAAADKEPLGVVDVGSTRLSFRDMMLGLARERGLKRIILPVPVLTPKLAARWIGLVTPIPNALAVPIVAGVVNSLVADTAKAEEHFPKIRPLPYSEAVARALSDTRMLDIETRWSGSLGSYKGYQLKSREGFIEETRTRTVNADAEAVFGVITSLGGKQGWLRWNWAWRLRGLIDRLIGGPGLRRGRRHPTELLEGEALDFWRVERLEANRLLRLQAEMKLPGRAWLQFSLFSENGSTRLVQTAWFKPFGLGGLLYWYILYPFHRIIFRDMINAIARRAEQMAAKIG